MTVEKPTKGKTTVDDDGPVFAQEEQQGSGPTKKKTSGTSRFSSQHRQSARKDSPLPPPATSGTADDAIYYGEAIPLNRSKLEEEDSAAQRQGGSRPIAVRGVLDPGIGSGSGITGAGHRSNKRPQDPFLKLFGSAKWSRKKYAVSEEEPSPAASDAPSQRSRYPETETSRESEHEKRSHSASGSGVLQSPRLERTRQHCSTPAMCTAKSPLSRMPRPASSPLPLPLTTPVLAEGPSGSPLRATTVVTPITAIPARSSVKANEQREGLHSCTGVPSSRTSSAATHTTAATASSPNNSLSKHGSPISKGSVPTPNTTTLVLDASDSSIGGDIHHTALRVVDWVLTPLNCEYHSDLQRRCENGQLLNSPYERLLAQCIAATLVQEVPFDSHMSFDDVAEASPTQASSAAAKASLAKVKELYTQWRAHRHAGEDIALASNRHNADPLLGLIQHRLALEWRMETLRNINYYVHDAYQEGQQSYQLLLSANDGTNDSTSSGADDSRSGSYRQRNHRHERSLSLTASPLQLPASPLGDARAGTATLPARTPPSSYSSHALPSAPAAAATAAVPPPPPAPPSVAVMAARTAVLCWFRRINLCQLFEDLFADTVAMAADLPLFLPASFVAYYDAKRRSKSGISGSSFVGAGEDELSDKNSGLAPSTSLYREYVRQKARAKYMREQPKQVWQAERTYVKEILSTLLLCWQKHDSLRREMRQSAQKPCRRASPGQSTKRTSNRAGSRLSSPGYQPSLLMAVASPPLSFSPFAHYVVASNIRESDPKPPPTLLELFELAGLVDVNAILLFAVHSSENAAAAAVALQAVADDARKAARSSGVKGSGQGLAGSEEDVNSDAEGDEEVLFSAQNLSPANLEEPERPVIHSDPHATAAASFSFSGGSFASPSHVGSARRIKVVVGSPMLMGMSPDWEGGEEGSPSAHLAPTLTSPLVSSLSAQTAGQGTGDGGGGGGGGGGASFAKREKHVTFVLEPFIFEDGGAAQPGQRSAGGEDGEAAHGQGEQQGGAAARLSEFTWKRYYDEKGEVSNVFAKRNRANNSFGALNSAARTGQDAAAEDIPLTSGRLRAQRQRVLQLFFKLDEEDGAQRLKDGLHALRRTEESLRRQLSDIDQRIREIKAGCYAPTTTTLTGGSGACDTEQKKTSRKKSHKEPVAGLLSPHSTTFSPKSCSAGSVPQSPRVHEAFGDGKADSGREGTRVGSRKNLHHQRQDSGAADGSAGAVGKGSDSESGSPLSSSLRGKRGKQGVRCGGSSSCPTM